MFTVQRGSVASFKFLFIRDGVVYDPVNQATPVDVRFSIIRGELGNGPVVDGPYSYLNQPATPDSDTYIEVANNGEYTFNYKIPGTLFHGKYSVLANTFDSNGSLDIQSFFQINEGSYSLNPVVIANSSNTVVNYRPSYDQINKGNTSTLLLLGHCNNLPLNEPVEINDVQSAVDILGADDNSPLLRGVFDAYAAGARDIVVCSVARMNEYVSLFENRLTATDAFEYNESSPAQKTFYEKYYERLETTYSMIKELDFVDMVVPLEASMIRTGGVDFVSQLANYCTDFHNYTGNVQIGFIGSRTGGVNPGDVSEIISNSVLVNKLTTFSADGNIATDNGRFIVPIYGEVVFKHPHLFKSYIGSPAAAVAGMAASASLSSSLVKKRIPEVMSLYGLDLTNEQHSLLDSYGINTVYRGKKTRRSVPFEVYLSNEYTLSNSNSSLHKLAQMRLVSRIVSEIKYFAEGAIGKFSYDKVRSQSVDFMESLKGNDSIVDYSLNIKKRTDNPGELIFYVDVLSSLGLKNINFSLSAGPAV